MKYKKQVDGLRASAVISVIFFMLMSFQDKQVLTT